MTFFHILVFPSSAKRIPKTLRFYFHEDPNEFLSDKKIV